MIKSCLALTLLVPFQTCQPTVKVEAHNRPACVRKPWLVRPPHQKVPTPRK